MADESGEKSEEPTQKKLDDVRKKGQVWKSKDMTGVWSFVIGLGCIKAMAPFIREQFDELFAYGFGVVAQPPESYGRAMLEVMLLALAVILKISVPIAFACAIGCALVDFLQVGPLFAKDAMKPKLEKLNPVAGFKNLFGTKQLVELIKNLLKIGITFYVVFRTVQGSLDLLAGATRGDENTILAVLAELIFRLALRVSILFMIFAVFDVWWQRTKFMKDNRMTKDQVKREYKESEGDPHNKAKRKEMHMEILESAQMEAVAGADVVVTNPDHVAVALRYDRERDGAPTVVCKGLDAVAEEIKRRARDKEVTILRNVPLAHALLRVDLEQEIPEELYDAVAEVLNFVYELREQHEGRAGRPLPNGPEGDARAVRLAVEA